MEERKSHLYFGPLEILYHCILGPIFWVIAGNGLLSPQVRGKALDGSFDDSIITTKCSVVAEEHEEERAQQRLNKRMSSSVNAALKEDLKKVVQKTASTFAPRASTATKNPVVPGTALYTVFEVQGYASMLLGGALSFNRLFPWNEPDIWRLMGMWSIWMFTTPSLWARDCSKNEKEALNYLFLLIPLLDVIIPFFWKSFPIVWLADTVAFFGMYAWKMGWLQRTE
ncbi:protein RESISTANCE TO PHYTOPHTHORA 1, chloroplastic-like isoform X2 [Punica granatum]|uniref:Protein RESISTANCE TO PHYTOPHTHORA 1, chloroplastic-like isoform X2 n=3 Tax=Punica granatum TaxID=22663 RepID=A0A6P8C965_PUNGR|nr:protein RESISTANCE TO PHYTOPHTHORA 1, chloroplastic-like isoform X2 [Punica granatum]